jgi:hypothetical protein
VVKPKERRRQAQGAQQDKNLPALVEPPSLPHLSQRSLQEGLAKSGVVFVLKDGL